MRSTTLSLAVLVAAALAVVPMTTQAATFGGEVFGAFNTYSMGDWNDAIDESNDLGSEYNNMTNGLTGGLGLRTWANQNWMFSVVWEPLFLNTEDETSDSKLSFDANSFQLTGAYFFPSTTNQRYGIGAGLGHYSVNGEAESGGTTVDLEGSTVGFHFMGLGEWRVSPGFAINAAAGYRIANVDEIEADGTVVENADGPIQTDYSGFMSRVGLSFYLPSGSN